MTQRTGNDEEDAVGEAPRAEEVGRRTTRRLHSLTGLRAIGALVVFLHHSTDLQTGPLGTVLSPFGEQGRLGVAFFFILSGFVLTWAWRPTDTARAFYRRRFARIYPAYFVALAVAFAGLVVQKGESDFGLFITSAALLQSWVPDNDVFFGINGVAWSLSDEAFFYACFPLLIPVLARLRQRTQWIALGAVVITSFIVRGAASILAPGDVATTEWPIHIFPVTRLLDFVAGLLVALIFLGGWRPRLSFAVAGALAGGTYIAAAIAPALYVWEAVTLVPFLLLIATAAATDSDGRRSLLRTRAWIWAGEISFSFYLVHQIVLRAVRSVLPGDPGAALESVVLAGALFASVAAAWLLFVVVERPLERRLRG